MPSKIAPRPGSSSDLRGSVRSSIDAARRKLGGRPTAPSRRAPGAPVRAVLRDGKRHVGVVLWCSEKHCDVWFDDGFARRMRPESVTPYTGGAPDALSCIAGEVRLFASLAESDLVRWERSAGLRPPVAEGCIVEKCRYGAIVVMRDGKLVAVGFRRLWPAVVRGVA
jgi:hypothetical protein